MIEISNLQMLKVVIHGLKDDEGKTDTEIIETVKEILKGDVE